MDRSSIRQGRGISFTHSDHSVHWTMTKTKTTMTTMALLRITIILLYAIISVFKALFANEEDPQHVSFEIAFISITESCGIKLGYNFFNVTNYNSFLLCLSPQQTRTRCERT